MITREEFESASDAGRRETLEHGALSVRYDEEADRVIIELPGDMLVVFPPDSVEGLAKATVADLQSMEIGVRASHTARHDTACPRPV